MSIGVGSASAWARLWDRQRRGSAELGGDRVRQFLVESVDYLPAPLLETLPTPDQARAEALKARLRRTASLDRLPSPAARRGAGSPTGGPEFREGRLVIPESGRRWVRAENNLPRDRRALLWDYALQISSGQRNYTFKGNRLTTSAPSCPHWSYLLRREHGDQVRLPIPPN